MKWCPISAAPDYLAREAALHSNGTQRGRIIVAENDERRAEIWLVCFGPTLGEPVTHYWPQRLPPFPQ